MGVLHWESIKQTGATHGRLRRARVPGGWLLIHSGPGDETSLVFYPEPDHAWEVECEQEGELPQGRSWERR